MLRSATSRRCIAASTPRRSELTLLREKAGTRPGGVVAADNRPFRSLRGSERYRDLTPTIANAPPESQEIIEGLNRWVFGVLGTSPRALALRSVPCVRAYQ